MTLKTECEWQSVRITEKDILSQAYAINSEQLILNILKNKGLPLKGLVYLEPHPHYEYQHQFDSLTGERLVKYRLKKNEL